MSEYILRAAREESIVLSAAAADALLSGGNGDAALLYIAFLRGDGKANAASLGWSGERFLNAARVLEGMGLLARPEGGGNTPPVQSVIERSQERPEYTNADLVNALASREFESLSRAVDQALGKKLTTPDQKILLGLYDDLGLSADVIFLLVNFCIERAAARYGAGRRPTMRQIEQEGYAWARMELTDQERASAYIKKQHRLRETLPRLMRLLGLGDRKLSASEERYLTAWSEMGFEDVAIELAYDKTMLKCKELKWPYMNKILTVWHERGLHTIREIEEGDRPGGARNAPRDENAAQREDLALMEKYLQQLRQEREKGDK